MGGHANTWGVDVEPGKYVDVVLMAKMLVLQSWYSLSDERLEATCNDRLTFQNFPSYPDSVPDARTVWFFRERMASTGKDREFWEALNSRLENLGKEVRGGHVKEVMLVELGGLKPEGSAGKAVEVSKDTAHLGDSTMLEADSGAPTAEDVTRREQIEVEAKKDKAADGGTVSLSSEELSRTKEMKRIQESQRMEHGQLRVGELLWFKLHTRRKRA